MFKKPYSDQEIMSSHGDERGRKLLANDTYLMTPKILSIITFLGLIIFLIYKSL